jgi:ADP-heptose:LPS heptosyltransferase
MVESTGISGIHRGSRRHSIPLSQTAVRIRPLETLLRWSLRLAKALDGRDDALDRIDPAAVRCVLLISSTALGDAVLSTAAFAPLRRRFPAARLVALVHAPYLPLFRHCPGLDEVVASRGGWRGFSGLARRLRRERPDIALVLHGNEPQATPLAYLSGARWIVKLPNANNPFRFLLANREPPVAWAELGHGLDQRLRTAALVGADTAGARMALPVTDDAAAAADAFLAGTGLADLRLAGFQCGASAASRMWPAESFVELGRRLLAAHADLALVLTGAPGERDLLDGIARRINEGANGPARCVAAAALPIEALPALVGCLDVLVSGDTGTMHVAVAMRTPTVCLFAVSDPATSGPAHDRERGLHIVIHRPCPDLAIGTKSDDARCIARIGVDEVQAAVERQLAQAPR